MVGVQHGEDPHLERIFEHRPAVFEQHGRGMPQILPRLAIDNDLAFSGFANPVALVDTDWSTLFVPALSAAHVDRFMIPSKKES